MNNIIKCPICHETAGLRYNENRVYQSRCQNMACRETVTVTAPSWKDAEELFSKFEKVTSQPKLSIPKKIAELLDIGYAYEGDEERDHSWLIHNMDDFTSPESYDEFYNWLEDSEDNYSLAIVYLAGKALGVDLVKVGEG